MPNSDRIPDKLASGSKRKSGFDYSSERKIIRIVRSFVEVVVYIVFTGILCRGFSLCAVAEEVPGFLMIGTGS